MWVPCTGQWKTTNDKFHMESSITILLSLSSTAFVSTWIHGSAAMWPSSLFFLCCWPSNQDRLDQQSVVVVAKAGHGVVVALGQNPTLMHFMDWKIRGNCPTLNGSWRRKDTQFHTFPSSLWWLPYYIKEIFKGLELACLLRNCRRCLPRHHFLLSLAEELQKNRDCCYWGKNGCRPPWPSVHIVTPMPPQPFWTFLGGGGDTFQGKKNAAKTINAK